MTRGGLTIACTVDRNGHVLRLRPGCALAAPKGDLAWWHENHAFQPASVVADLDLPVLLLYEENDWIAPPVENGEKLKTLFLFLDYVELRVIAGGDHRPEIPSGLDGRDAGGGHDMEPRFTRSSLTGWKSTD